MTEPARERDGDQPRRAGLGGQAGHREHRQHALRIGPERYRLAAAVLALAAAAALVAERRAGRTDERVAVDSVKA